MTIDTADKIALNEPIELAGRVLFVDDDENILNALRRLTRKQGVECFFAHSGAEALALLKQQEFEVIVSDMRMPQMDGAELLSICRDNWPKATRILLTGHADIEASIRALNRGGIYRYLSKPWDDNELLEAINQGLRICNLERDKQRLLSVTREQNAELAKFNSELEQRVQARTEEIKQTADMLELVYQQLQDSYTGFIKLFASVIASRNHLEKSRAPLVAEIAQKLALALQLPPDEIKHIYHAGLLMDLGKLHLSDQLLQYPEEKIPPDKRSRFEQHPLLAEMTLSAISELEPVALLVRSHMEAVDGSGFPDKLKGNATARGARILRVARDFIGLQTGLIKDTNLKLPDALRYIKELSGKKYDPFVVKTLEQISAELNLGEDLNYEMKVDTNQLTPNMVVSRDIYNSTGILMIARGFKLSQNIIQKLESINAMSESKLKVFVYKEGTTL